MPELAEVEFFRRRWDAGLGEAVTAVQLHGAKRVFRGSDPRQIAKLLTGKRLVASRAIGKQMLFSFSGGAQVGIHLGMSGALRTEAAGFRAEKHDHLVLQQKKRALIFRDPRLFGRVRFHDGKGETPWLAGGPPEIHSAAFDQRFVAGFLERHRRAPIKAVLLSQKGFPGIGNWMADEILWRAHLAPKRLAGSLTRAEQAAFRRATRFVSAAAMRIIGVDYADPPATWLIHERWKRAGVCPKHGTRLKRETVGGRTTAWCARCQH